MSDARPLRHQLRAAGFCPIPLYGKAPPAYGKNNTRKGLARWQELHEVTPKQIDMWERTWPDAHNTGVLTRLMPTLDLDILNPEAVEAAEALVREHYEDHGAILVRIGLPPKRAIPFRTKEPFDKIIVNLVAPNSSLEKPEKIEFLGEGQQVVVAGIHPDTKQPYRWHGGEPGQVKLEELPCISAAEARQLVDDIVDLLVRDFGYTRAPERPKARCKGNGAARETGGESGAADWHYLFDNIRNGHALHDSLRDLAAKLIASGTSGGAAVNQMRALMESSTAPHDDRWKARLEDIPRLVTTAKALQEREREAQEQKPATAPKSLADVHKVFIRWLGEEYDLDTLDAMLAVAGGERLPGDPAWLLIVSGSGNAKTETVQATSELKTEAISTISSEGALLSASRVKGKQATGGLLRKIGDHGILAIKDFTSILSCSDRNTRAAILAALREIHDGKWVRNVGIDGGQTLEWRGRIVVIGACTTAWDQAHGVIAVMGDRFVLVRPSSYTGRISSGLHAIRNTGSEATMRKELAEAVAALVNNINSENAYELTPEDRDVILKAADLVTRARTGVKRDYRGDVIDAHDPEMPTRFAKQLTQIMRGAIAIGMEHQSALNLVLRCAKDSIPQLRLALLIDLASHPHSPVIDIRRRLQRPRLTIDRALQELHVLGLLMCEEEEEQRGEKTIQKRFYSLAKDTNPDVLTAQP